MQQTKSYWRLVAVAGVVSAFVASACVVTTTTDSGFAGAAGGTSAGAGGAGAGAGGAATAGAPSAGAGTIIAGAGGAGAVPFQCDPGAGGAQGTPNSCQLSTDEMTDDCAVCIKTTCCTEFGQCYATDPGNQCGWGGPDNGGEFTCYRDCLTVIAMKNGAIEDADRGTCAANCATKKTSKGSMDCSDAIGEATNSLIACIADAGCNMACYGG